MFKPVTGFPDYMINENGSDILNRNFKTISTHINKYGYEVCSLYVDGKKKLKTIHSLVMETFCGERPEDMLINHKSGVKDNNYWENLEYCTSSYNSKHAYDSGLRSAVGEKNGYSKLAESDILQIRSLLGKMSQKGISEIYNIDQSTVSNIKTGKLWSHVK